MEILYEDNHCLLVNKPAPLMTQAPPGVPSLEAFAKEYLRTKYAKKGRVYLGIPHRLDRPVTGVVLFARSTKAAQRLSEQFQGRQVEKVYWGLVEGRMADEEATWEDWMRKVPDTPRAEKAEPDTEGARLAVLQARVLGAWAGGSRLEFRPMTGRMHQIRLQAALRGLPILGDLLYGAAHPFGPQVELPRDRIIALHARSLTFLHPIRYEPVTATAPLPPEWNDR